MNSDNSPLCATEWIVATAIILLLFSFVLTAKIQAFRVGSYASEESQPVQVSILGHVAKPGSFMVERGTPLPEVLLQAKPLPYADLTEFSPSNRVAEDQTHTIKKITTLTIFVEGACHPVELQVPPGTRLCDLKGQIELQPKGDPATFKSRRCLKNKEIIKIPLKN